MHVQVAFDQFYRLTERRPRLATTPSTIIIGSAIAAPQGGALFGALVGADVAAVGGAGAALVEEVVGASVETTATARVGASVVGGMLVAVGREVDVAVEVVVCVGCGVGVKKE